MRSTPTHEVLGVPGRYHNQDYYLRDSGEEQEQPIPFARGSYTDAVLEKADEEVPQRETNSEGVTLLHVSMPDHRKSEEYWAS